MNIVAYVPWIELSFVATRKCPLRGHCLAPPEGLGTQGNLGSSSGVNPRGQGLILRRFKQKKNFCDVRTEVRTEVRMDGQTCPLK